MPDRFEHMAAFEQIADHLRAGAAAAVRARHAHRHGPAATDLEHHLEHTLDRLAMLYGRGTYENIPTADLVESAIAGELRLGHEVDAIAPGSSAGNLARARALVDAARRGVGLRVQPPGSPAMLRGVHVSPLRPELERALRRRREPYMMWRGGAVVVLAEAEFAALRAAGDRVAVLFLDPDELLDLAAREDQPALEAELARRLAAAHAAHDHVGESRARHLRRSLLHQSTVLRNLRDRLAAEHPAAHAALLPILADHRAQLEAALVAAPAALAEPADPLDAAIAHERALQALVARWAAEPDDAGFAIRYATVAGAGSRLATLERHRP